MKALLLENIHPEAHKILTERGFEVESRPGSLGEDELIESLSGIKYLGIRSNTKLTKRVFAEVGNELEAVGAFCIGTNQIDLKSASESGVAVFNAPYSNTRSVVELALAEIVMMARRLTVKNSMLHRGIWDKSAKGSHEIRNRTLGIVGYGNIGSQLSIVAEAMGMRVIFYDLVDKLALGNARRVDTLEELLCEAETISLHIDGRPSNAGLFGDQQFQQMRPRSLFLNLCRGNVVDYAALRRHLESGHIAGAAVDVFPNEPRKPDDLFANELQGIDNVILTPHIGGSTQEAQLDIGRFVAGKLADFADFGSTTLSVNYPEVSVTDYAVRRILHLHHNVPGVLARLNSTLANHDMNIGSQTLATKDSLGYVVTDISGAKINGLLQELSILKETVRVRIL